MLRKQPITLKMIRRNLYESSYYFHIFHVSLNFFGKCPVSFP